MHPSSAWFRSSAFVPTVRQECGKRLRTPPSTPSFAFCLKANNSVATSPNLGEEYFGSDGW